MNSKIKEKKLQRKHWIKLGIQICKLYLNKKNNQTDLTNLSYNKIAHVYDLIWTDHVQVFSKDLVNRLLLPISGTGLDLSCGTGYVTGLLAKKINGDVTGVDISKGMLEIANQKYGNRCKFVCSDIIEYLKKQPSKSVDVVTCAWGLGFTKPFKTIKEISRVLKPNGQVGIIDNSLFTVYEITISGISTVSEYPSAITNVMNVRWLPFIVSLTGRMRICGLKVISSWKGEKTYYAKNSNDAINHLIKTGTAAGYEYCFKKQYSQIIKHRFAEILEKLYGSEKGMPITHRYIAAIATKS
jgi:ubiquinone/menaquinone biosynthesis C-methylase UbiE